LKIIYNLCELGPDYAASVKMPELLDFSFLKKLGKVGNTASENNSTTPEDFNIASSSVLTDNPSSDITINSAESTDIDTSKKKKYNRKNKPWRNMDALTLNEYLNKLKKKKKNLVIQPVLGDMPKANTDEMATFLNSKLSTLDNKVNNNTNSSLKYGLEFGRYAAEARKRHEAEKSKDEKICGWCNWVEENITMNRQNMNKHISVYKLTKEYPKLRTLCVYFTDLSDMLPSIKKLFKEYPNIAFQWKSRKACRL